MPRLTGNILHLNALLVAAFSDVGKGSANKGQKPDCCKSLPREYTKWYSLDATNRSADDTVAFDNWQARTLARVTASLGGTL